MNQRTAVNRPMWGQRLAKPLPLALLLAALACHGAAAQMPAFKDGAEGASCTHFDVGLAVPWPENAPSWIDAKATVGGSAAFARHTVAAGDVLRVRRIDVHKLVAGWWSRAFANDGLVLRLTGGNALSFMSRENPDTALRPVLFLQWADGRKRFVEAAADVSLDCSTYRSLGTLPTLLLASHAAVAMRFDLSRLQSDPAPTSAELVLTRDTSGLGAASSFDVQRLHLPFGSQQSDVSVGLAAAYRRDEGIERDPDVYFAEGFERGVMSPRWTTAERAASSLVATDSGTGFEPLNGHALRATIRKGQQLGLDLRYKFLKQHGAEPEEAYFRYYLRLGSSWQNASEGGKLPGFAGTYGKVGWGGRGWDGSKGWSARGAFGQPSMATSAATAREPVQTMLGSYVYHAKAGSDYGEIMTWSGAGLSGLITADRWVCIEQRLKMNTPQQQDGVLQVWINGRLALSRNDMRWRDSASVKIEEVWLNVFHGGTKAANGDMHAYLDHIVIAKRYIGPLAP